MSVSKTLKYCISCEHHSFDDHCLKSEPVVDLVSGLNKWERCDVMRSDFQKCGYEAKLFELKDAPQYG
jgi:hypothetical protein